MKKAIGFFAIVLALVAVYVISRNYFVFSRSRFVINAEDREDLELFFRELICKHHFGYTLFGDKPVSIAGYFEIEPNSNLLFGNVPAVSLGSLWNVWQKYLLEIDSKKYLILNESHPNSSNLRIITLVNKLSVVRTIQSHFELFQTFLGVDFTADKLLAKLTKPGSSLFSELRKNEVLYGILLGYGKENAVLFERRWKLSRFADPLFQGTPIYEDPYSRFSLYFPHPLKPFHSIEEEYHYLKNQGMIFDLHTELSAIASPYFLAKKCSQETIELTKKYRELHRRLVKLYEKGKYLDLTLEQLYD